MLTIVLVCVGTGLILMGLISGAIPFEDIWCTPAERCCIVPPRPVVRRPETPRERPFPLVLPARAGWGTMMDLASTRVYRPSEFGEPIVPHRIISVG